MSSLHYSDEFYTRTKMPCLLDLATSDGGDPKDLSHVTFGLVIGFKAPLLGFTTSINASQ